VKTFALILLLSGFAMADDYVIPNTVAGPSELPRLDRDARADRTDGLSTHQSGVRVPKTVGGLVAKSFTGKPDVLVDIMVISAPQNREVIRIAHDGTLFWHGREVTTDKEFKAAMLALARYLRGDFSADAAGPGP
jgi:hypothetical protein